MFAKTAQYERMVTESTTTIKTITGKNRNIEQFTSFLLPQADLYPTDVPDTACYQGSVRAALDRVCELCGRYR